MSVNRVLKFTCIESSPFSAAHCVRCTRIAMIISARLNEGTQLYNLVRSEMGMCHVLGCILWLMAITRDAGCRYLYSCSWLWDVCICEGGYSVSPHYTALWTDKSPALLATPPDTMIWHAFYLFLFGIYFPLSRLFSFFFFVFHSFPALCKPSSFLPLSTFFLFPSPSISSPTSYTPYSIQFNCIQMGWRNI